MYTDIAPGNEHPYRMPVAFRIFAGHGSLLDAGAAGETLMAPFPPGVGGNGATSTSPTRQSHQLVRQTAGGAYTVEFCACEGEEERPAVGIH
jgi:hypothetical protein